MNKDNMAKDIDNDNAGTSEQQDMEKKGGNGQNGKGGNGR
jgi:hypothetical protein